MNQPLLVINVYGGLVQDVFASSEDVRVIAVDWDLPDREASERGVVRLTCDGREYRAHVSEITVAPITALLDTEVHRALLAAGIADGMLG